MVVIVSSDQPISIFVFWMKQSPDCIANGGGLISVYILSHGTQWQIYQSVYLHLAVNGRVITRYTPSWQPMTDWAVCSRQICTVWCILLELPSRSQGVDGHELLETQQWENVLSVRDNNWAKLHSMVWMCVILIWHITVSKTLGYAKIPRWQWLINFFLQMCAKHPLLLRNMINRKYLSVTAVKCIGVLLHLFVTSRLDFNNALL